MRGTLACAGVAALLLGFAWPCGAEDEEPVRCAPAPPVLVMIYESGRDDGKHYDLASPYSPLGSVRVRPGERYPWGIYGNRHGDFASRIDLYFKADEPMDLVFVLDMAVQKGSDGELPEIRVLLNGALLREVDIAPRGAEKPCEHAVIDVPAEKGTNVITLDMSAWDGWESCHFDAVRLYERDEEEPEGEPAGE
jgi:hypothetical protein